MSVKNNTTRDHHSEESNSFLRIRSVQHREHIFMENDNRKSLSLYHELCNYVIWGAHGGGAEGF